MAAYSQSETHRNRERALSGARSDLGAPDISRMPPGRERIHSSYDRHDSANTAMSMSSSPPLHQIGTKEQEQPPSQRDSRSKISVKKRSRHYSDLDSAYGSMPSNYGSPPVASAASKHNTSGNRGDQRQRTPPVDSDSDDDFDKTYGFKNSET